MAGFLGPEGVSRTTKSRPSPQIGHTCTKIRPSLEHTLQLLANLIFTLWTALWNCWRCSLEHQSTQKGEKTCLIGQDQEGWFGVEEGLVAQQEGRILVVAAADLTLAGARVQQAVVHHWIIVGANPTSPGPISAQPRLSVFPGQPLDLHTGHCSNNWATTCIMAYIVS